MPEDFHLTKDCPVCGSEMHKDSDADERVWRWQCQCCEYREDLTGVPVQVPSIHTYPAEK